MVKSHGQSEVDLVYIRHKGFLTCRTSSKNVQVLVWILCSFDILDG